MSEKSTVTVSAAFRRHFEIFAEHRVSSGLFTPDEMEKLREVVRSDLRPGPDLLRADVDCLEIDGVKVKATIDDAAERYRLWDEYLSDEAESIALQKRMTA